MTDLKRIALLMALLALAAGLFGCGDKPDPSVDEDGEAALEEPAAPTTERRVTVLCYHAMSDGAESFYDVPTEDFAEQLAMMDERGYESVLPSEIADYLEGRADLPEKAVCLTFDDGPESILTESKPLMDQYGYTGAAFLITDAVGASGNLSWDQVRELQAAGWEIGSHTCSHEKPTKIDAEKCVAELEDSKAAIDAEIEGECTAVAYPYGLYDASVIEHAREAGYRVAFTIDRGPADWTDDVLRLPRQMVVNGNSLSTFGRWLDQEKLHLEDVTPAIGERVSEAEPTITARLADESVPPDGIEASVNGKPVSCEGDSESGRITLFPELSEGANNLRLNYYGSPRREVSWVIAHEPS